jgi:hypothetical protein
VFDCFDGLHRYSDYSLEGVSGNAISDSDAVDIVEHQTNPSVTSNGLGTSSSAGSSIFNDEIGPGAFSRGILESKRIWTVSLNGQTFVVPVRTEQLYLVEGIWWRRGAKGQKTEVSVNGTQAERRASCR